MSLIDSGVAASLTLKQRREYRAWAFPAALAEQTHVPFLSTDNPERWITTAGYHLYEYYASSSLPDLDIDEIPGDKLAEFQRAVR
uniref:Uncharacterized protein n=1 Tax=Mycena chlorophos TaxID=658473 RepID=A0ABQ0LBX9_MYCCL|nr:predicted protein [Mycena chlorophos]